MGGRKHVRNEDLYCKVFPLWKCPLACAQPLLRAHPAAASPLASQGEVCSIESECHSALQGYPRN